MFYIGKESGLLAGKWTNICLIFFAIFLIALGGCKSEIEPPVSKPEPVVQDSAVDEESAEIEGDEYSGEPEAGGSSKSEVDDDNVENSPPEVVSLKLIPPVVYAGTKVMAQAEGRDQEEEDVTFFYRWQKNEDFLPGEENEELDTSGFKKGDLITAFVTPFDGEVEGKQVMSKSLLVSNRPPDIISAPIGNIRDGVFIYEVKAIDPDGDKLIFFLEGSPAGMRIDSSSGKVEWEIPTDAKGPFTIKVVVSDGDATAFQGFSIGEIVRELR